MLGNAAIAERGYDLMANRHYNAEQTIDHVRTKVAFDYIDGDYAQIEAAVADTLGQDMVALIDDAYDKGEKTIITFQIDADGYNEFGPYELETDWGAKANDLEWDVCDRDGSPIHQFTH